MHISDGVLSAPVWIGGYVAAGGVTAYTIRKITTEQLPKIGVVTAVFFVASLIHVPLGPTSVHLILNGLAGVVLGMAAFPSILLGLTLQCFLFQHGGITSLGANACMMGLSALAAYGIFNLRKYAKDSKAAVAIFGALAGASGTLFAGIILALLLVSSGENFFGVAKMAVLAHIPVMIIEGIITGFTASFLDRVKPELLTGNIY